MRPAPYALSRAYAIVRRHDRTIHLMSNRYHIFFVASGVIFIAASIIGLLGALKVAHPIVLLDFFPFANIRPLHTFLSISAVLVGLQGLVLAIVDRPSSRLWFWAYCGALGLFVVGGVAALATGQGTGREYFSWPIVLSAPLLAAWMMFLSKILLAGRQMERRSPEGFWLIGFGSVFILSGFLESHFWRFQPIAANFVQDLTIQWHGIDTFFAGINAVLYGCGVFMLSPTPKRVRSGILFGVAGFSLLFTFGHHHYISPQPNFLKTLAFIASMLAMVSFWRHLSAYKKSANLALSQNYALPLWRTVQLWTLVSIATGVLFAVPQLNLIVHGTYLVLIHAMGAMIGVNFMIIIAGGLIFSANRRQIRPARIRWGVRLVNVSLIGLWLILGTAGALKGIIRVDGDYYDFQPLREIALYGFPLIGAVLLGGIALLNNEMIRANLVTRQRNRKTRNRLVIFLSKHLGRRRRRPQPLLEFEANRMNPTVSRPHAERPVNTAPEEQISHDIKAEDFPLSEVQEKEKFVN